MEKKKIEQIAKKEQGIFEEVFGVLGDSQEDNLRELSALLVLPEDKFNLLAPAFLLGFKKSLNNAEDQITLAQILNAEGIPLEDLVHEYEVIMDSISSEFQDTLSLAKIDFLRKLMAMVINAVAETEGISKRIIQIPIELIHEDAKTPTYANIGDAGLDVYALDDYEIDPGETIIIPTGLKVALPLGYELQVRPRSGQSAKTKLRVANSPGTIDSGYRDEIGIIIENIEPKIADIDYKFNEKGEVVIESILHGKPYAIGKGQRFAQLVLSQVPMANFYKVVDVSQFGDDRLGGFGSTDENNN